MILHAWFAAWLLLTGACAGAIAWLAVRQVAGCPWDDRRLRWRLRRLLPLAAVAGVPLLIDAPHLFPWIRDPVEALPRWYFDYSFLVWRTVACFAAWTLAWHLSRRAPAVSLLVWLPACAVFANDWIVSLA